LGGLLMGLPLGVWMAPQVEKREKEKWFKGVAAVTYWGVFVLFCLLLWVGKPGPSQRYYIDCSVSGDTCAWGEEGKEEVEGEGEGEGDVDEKIKGEEAVRQRACTLPLL
jgi:hypothetical protein